MNLHINITYYVQFSVPFQALKNDFLEPLKVPLEAIFGFFTGLEHGREDKIPHKDPINIASPRKSF